MVCFASERNERPFAAPRFDPVTARLKTHDEDFEVHEIPAYAPSGRGEHLFVRFEKRGIDTDHAVRAIAAALGVRPSDAGFAGLKDRRAVTTQWASFFTRLPPEQVLALELPSIRTLEASRHHNKLRTGHLAGNRFVIRLRDVPAARVADLERTLRWLAEHGAPAYFGDQRYGRDGDNAARARRWILEGAPAPKRPFERKLLVSSLQAEVFDTLLAARIRAGELDRIVDGDLVRKEDTGGLFIADDLAEVQARANRLEVSATGPMLGADMRWPEREARRREEQAMREAGLTPEHLRRFRDAGPGARRPYRFIPRDASIAIEPDAVRVSFTLPPGAYATEILRELTRGGVVDVSRTTAPTPKHLNSAPDDER